MQLTRWYAGALSEAVNSGCWLMKVQTIGCVPASPRLMLSARCAQRDRGLVISWQMSHLPTARGRPCRCCCGMVPAVAGPLCLDSRELADLEDELLSAAHPRVVGRCVLLPVGSGDAVDGPPLQRKLHKLVGGAVSREQHHQRGAASAVHLVQQLACIVRLHQPLHLSKVTPLDRRVQHFVCSLESPQRV